MSATKKHRHKYEKFVEWITAPKHPSDTDRYWVFTVKKSCDCGKVNDCDADFTEVEEYIKNATCASCGSFGKNHGSPSDCIRDLRLRVGFLEDRLEKVCDALSGIGRGL